MAATIPGRAYCNVKKVANNMLFPSGLYGNVDFAVASCFKRTSHSVQYIRHLSSLIPAYFKTMWSSIDHLVTTLVFLINVQARLFFGGSISPLHTHFYLVPARLLGTTYILIRPTLPISSLHAYLALHVY